MPDIKLNRNQRGFSLIELSLVVAVMALVSAFSIPRLNSAMDDMQMISDARNIATALTYAKISSTAQMIHYRVSFVLADNQWSVEKETSQNAGAFETKQAINSLCNGASTSGIVFKSTSGAAPTGYPTNSAGTITFNSRGMPIAGAQIVYLSKPDADFAVSVSITGRIQVWRFKNNQWIPQ
jgi:prepilin-type N-terminal cleavage/methylation domain-containing protein